MVRTRARATVAVAIAAGAVLAAPPTRAQAPPPPAAALRLEDLERVALERNPTIPQARAHERAVRGRERQAGLYPNPLVGYEAEDINQREPGRFKNFFWFQVPIVTAGKLQKSVDLAASETRLATVNLETQRRRVITTVRMLYYEALGAARLVALREELAGVTRTAVEISEELFNVGQADRPDVLDVEIQHERAELDLAKARSHQERMWRVLAATVGEPTLPLTPLAGDLEAGPPTLAADAVMARVLRESPEVERARVNVQRARAALERVRAERIPNLFVRTKLGYNAESYAPGKDVGFEAGVEIGIPLPLFDRQQGNLTAAQADLDHAQNEVRRLELDLRTQLAAALKAYEDARRDVDRYRTEILPRAQKSVELYEAGFKQMAAAYPQVLIARRNATQLRAEYIQALVDLWRGAALLEGMLLAGGLESPFHTGVQAPPPTGHLPSGGGRPAD